MTNCKWQTEESQDQKRRQAASDGGLFFQKTDPQRIKSSGGSPGIQPEILQKSKERGQVVVEYVLLLIIGVGVATLITSLMVSRNPESPGFLIVKWTQIIRTIGADYADALPPAEN